MHGLYYFLRVLGLEADGEGVHAAQVLEDQPLAFHHGQAGLRADVAQAQHAGAVRNHRHHVALVGVLVNLLRVRLYVLADSRNTWGVPDGEIVYVADTALGRNFDLALIERVQDHGVLSRLIRLFQQLFFGNFHI